MNTVVLPGNLYAMQQRWHSEGWRKCQDCLGDGHTEDMGDRFPCIECGGSGEVKMSFFDWLEEQEAKPIMQAAE